MQTATPYIPDFAITLKELPLSPLRIALQGAPHTGKTYSAMSFPSPIVAYDFDGKMGAHLERTDVFDLALHNNAFCEKVAAKYKITDWISKGVVKRWKIFEKMIEEDLPKYQAGQTILIDSWTMLMNNFHNWYDLHPPISQEGKKDPREFWGVKLKYGTNILEKFKTCPANLIVTFHESREEDAEGKPTGRYNPLMSGQLKEQLGQHFTDWYRQTAENKKDDKGNPTKDIEYMWQIKPNSVCKACCSVKHLIESGVAQVPATYKSLVAK